MGTDHGVAGRLNRRGTTQRVQADYLDSQTRCGTQVPSSVPMSVPTYTLSAVEVINPARQKELGQWMTTPAVAAAMARHAAPDDFDRILDPAAGTGELIIAALARADELGVASRSHVAGVELDPNLAEVFADRLGERAELVVGDFMTMDVGSLDPTMIIANPPYGSNREVEFFLKCDREARPGTLLIFLMPLSFLDRAPGTAAELVEGRPLGVTTGHAIVVHRAGEPLNILPVKGRRVRWSNGFEALTGLKVYEVGAGTPTQTRDLIKRRPYTSSTPIDGWLPCLRTGDLDAAGVKPARLWVDYGPHLASPKDLSRFSGPRLVMRRVPIWEDRRLCAHYMEETALCAGDLLVIKHEADSQTELQALARWLSGDEATALIHSQRPSVKHRDSFPKISAKDVYWLLEQRNETR